MPSLRGVFENCWVATATVKANAGTAPIPVGLAAANPETGVVVVLWDDHLRRTVQPPYPTDARTVVIAYGAEPVIHIHLALGWPPPQRLIDLQVEFSNTANGQRLIVGGLAGAMLWFGLPTHGALAEPNEPSGLCRRLAAVVSLQAAMLPLLDLGRALFRGRWMIAVTRMERAGLPVDVEMIERLRAGWPRLRERVAAIVDREFSVLDGCRLQPCHFEAWLAQSGISWPRLLSGSLMLNDDTFRDMARAYPALRPLKELRAILSVFDPGVLSIGPDGRNRVPLRPFATRTGRNAPGANQSVLIQAAWVRHFIRPTAGMGLALVDWSQQEFGIAAALSGDKAMLDAYRSGDPYLAFAVMAGAAPPDATRDTCGETRSRFKICALGVQYGMGPATLSRLIGQSESGARDLLQWHRRAFPTYWRWSDAIEAHALLTGKQISVSGWRLAVGADANPRGLRNFPLQANGAEMLRLACCLVTEAGISVCAPNHDALVIEAPARDL